MLIESSVLHRGKLTISGGISSITPAQQRILGALARHPNLAVADIAAQAFVGVTTLACGGYIRALKARRLVHVSGWRKVRGRFSTPLYSGGDKLDVARPSIDESNRAAPGMERIVDALTELGALSYREIARFSGLSPNTVKNSGYLQALLAQRRIHIAQWRRSSKGPISPLYAAGPGENAEKPDVLSPGERNHRHRLRRTMATGGGELSTQLAGLLGSARGSG